MPVIRPRKLSPRGILAELLPQHFRRPKHAQQILAGDSSSVKVPWDADELFDRITFKTKKLRKSTMSMYETANRSNQPLRRLKNTTWCVATGRWVLRTKVLATPIFPKALGSSIMSFVCHFQDLWAPVNSLMLPKPASQALEDLALMIVPNNAQQASAPFPDGYKFRVMDPTHPAASTALYKSGAAHDLPELSVAQLDGKQLSLGNGSGPMHGAIYFHSCCAVWKKTFLENPQYKDEADFAARFLGNILEYWPRSYVEHNKATDVFLLKYRESLPSSLILNPSMTDALQRFRARSEEGDPKKVVQGLEATLGNVVQPTTNSFAEMGQEELDFSSELRKAEKNLLKVSPQGSLSQADDARQEWGMMGREAAMLEDSNGDHGAMEEASPCTQRPRIKKDLKNLNVGRGANSLAAQ